LEQGHSLDEWEGLTPRLDRNMGRLLDLLSETSTRATCFILGWVVENHPGLCRRILAAGHEIASHGYGHELVYEIGRERFRDDLRRSLAVTEETLGIRPRGYRAAGFSIRREELWALDILAEEGLEYDSSLFPAPRGHGGSPGVERLPSRLVLESGRSLLEFPISVTRILGRPVAYSGGGYLRLFPYRYIRRQVAAANARGEPVIVYVHPRDLDPTQPRLSMSWRRRFKSYVNLGTTYRKLRRLLTEFRFGAVEDVLGI
jgi:polysaccharide deacetylase family protein (PEP-CTERM system associated)